MRAIASILIVIGFALSGCSNPRHYWFNPEKTLSEARQDCRECYSQAINQAAEDIEYVNYQLSPEMRQTPPRLLDSNHPNDPEFWIFDERTFFHTNYRENIFRGCMSSRGYRLTREDELGRRIRKSSLRAGKVAGK
jgi:hypothetical protein